MTTQFMPVLKMNQHITDEGSFFESSFFKSVTPQWSSLLYQLNPHLHRDPGKSKNILQFIQIRGFLSQKYTRTTFLKGKMDHRPQ
jgi:hypothetical protein